jgi:hypothetical protein
MTQAAARPRTLAQWREHLVTRLRREYDASGDERLAGLVTTYAAPGPRHSPEQAPGEQPVPSLVVPLVLRVGDHDLSLISTTTVFGTTREVTLSEVAIEAFYPADDATRALLA